MANPQPNIWHAPMPLICSSFEPGHLDDVIEAMPDNDYRTIALAEAAYFRGKADEACRLAEPFLTSDVLALRISSCFICGFANLSLDHAHAARACLLNLASSKEHLNDEYGDRERAAYLLFTASSSVLLHLKPPVTADDFLQSCRPAARRPPPIRDLRHGSPGISHRRLRPLHRNGRKRPGDEAGALSHL